VKYAAIADWADHHGVGKVARCGVSTGDVLLMGYWGGHASFG
jgi:hypothetical protein